MPSQQSRSYHYESCVPCKWFSRRLTKSGFHPIRESTCTHDDATGGMPSRLEHGRYIGENTDIRPQWCPIRGNAEAEKDAADTYIPGLER